MNILDFTNKTIITEKTIKETAVTTSISERISPDLFADFSNLNFSGVYRLGSENISADCYIGSAYNITLKVIHHVNLLYRGEHHSRGLQEWVNKNGLESIDISLLKRTKSIPDDFENWEQYFLNQIKPNFNTVLNKRIIKVETKQYTPLRYANVKELNELGKPIITPRKRDTQYNELIVSGVATIGDEERSKWKPTIIINTEDIFSRRRGDITNIKVTKKVDVDVEVTYVYRTGVFKV